MTARRRRRRRREIAVVVVAGVVALAGCSAPEEASDLPTPTVVWVQGEPSGGLWASEWADAYMNAAIQRSAARAYGDYSDPEFVAAVGYERVKYEASIARDDRFDGGVLTSLEYELNGVLAFWGDVTHIEVAADGNSAWVYGCMAKVYDTGEIYPVADHVPITRVAEGIYRVGPSSAGGERGGSCTMDNVVVAEWADPIDLEDVGRDSVKMPLPREYYVELGVIDE